MSVQLHLTYDQLKTLALQLSAEEQARLVSDLLAQPKPPSVLTVEEKLALYHSAVMSVPVNEAPCIRREDWYGDDGR